MTNRTKLAVILHADVVGSTELVRADELLAHERIHSAFQRLADTVGSTGGIAHEIRGDALVAEFDRASDAVISSLAFQAENSGRNAALIDNVRPELRIGIALGEVVIADATLTGTGVVLAQRLEQLAEPGGVCISAAIREALPGRLSLRYTDLGEQELKGFDYPQRGYLVLDNQAAPPTMPMDIPGKADVSGAAGSQRASIAVLPFSNLSSDPEQGYFADGMTEDIITALSKFKELLVIARGTTFTYKGQAVDIPTVARQLNVHYVLEGSIRSAGGRVRVTAQLIDAATTSPIWGNRFDRALDDVFAIQDELSEAVTAAVAPQVDRAARERVRRTPPSTLDAWSCLQLGVSRWMEMTAESVSQAEDRVREAFAIDPRYAQAFAWASLVRGTLRVTFGHEQSMTAEATAQARTWAETAVQLDATDALGHCALGFSKALDGDLQGATGSLETAVTLNPNFAVAHHLLGLALQRNGCSAEALEHIEVALRLNPYDRNAGHSHLLKAGALRQLHRYSEAIEHANLACNLMPNAFLPHVLLAAIYALADRMDEGKAALARGLNLKPDLTIEWMKTRRGHIPPEVGDLTIEGLKKLGLSEGNLAGVDTYGRPRSP